jgi:hypothetical protein
VSDNLIETVAPYLSPPVMRAPGGTVADSGDGADLSLLVMAVVAVVAFAGIGDE